MVHIVHFRQGKDKGMPVGGTTIASSGCGATQPSASEDSKKHTLRVWRETATHDQETRTAGGLTAIRD